MPDMKSVIQDTEFRGTRAIRVYRRGFSLVELIVVLVIMGVVAGLAIPRLNLAGYRVDAFAQQVRSALQLAQRTSITRQYDVIVSIDTVRNQIGIAEDRDNSGTITGGESRVWRAGGSNEGNTFSAPPKGIGGDAVRTAVVGSAIKKIEGMPSIIFHRDGSASTDAELYIQNTSRGRPQYRAIVLTRSTGRAAVRRLAGTGAGAIWQDIR